MKKRQHQNARGYEKKTFDEKSGNPKMQGAKKKRQPMKKEPTRKYKGLRKKTSDEKRGNSKK
jgi:hypothetical protein